MQKTPNTRRRAKVRFDGVGDYFSVPDGNKDWQFGKEDFSIEMWFTFSIFTLAGNDFMCKRFLRRM